MIVHLDSEWLRKTPKKRNRSRAKNFPLVSVITPSYQQGEFIEETILSVINQSYSNIEYIIVDGGSTDDTVNVIRRYDDFITQWVSEPDKGQSDAINKGFSQANGEILCWLNSDDYYSSEEVISKVVELYQKNIGKDMIFFGESVYQFDKRQYFLKNNTTALRKKFEIFESDFVVQPSSFWSKHVWDKVGNLSVDKTFSFDWQWFIRAKYAGCEFVHLPKVLSVYRIHRNHKSGSGAQKRTLEISETYRKNLGDDAAELYVFLHSSKFNDTIRRLLKRSPVFLQKIYYYGTRSRVPFKTFQAVITM